MKNYLILIVFFITSCSSKNTSKNNEQLIKQDTLMINNVAYYLDSISEKEFKAISKPKDIENGDENFDDANISRDSLKLKFHLRNGADSILVSEDPDLPYFVAYTYLESCDYIDYWLVEVYYDEGGEYLLINKENGNKMYIWGPPVYSPDKRFFMCYSCDLWAGFRYNGLQLFEIQNKKVRLLWSKEIEYWAPTEIRWQNERTICIQKINKNNETSYNSMLIK